MVGGGTPPASTARLNLGDGRNSRNSFIAQQAFTALGPRQRDSESWFAVRGRDFQLWPGVAGTGRDWRGGGHPCRDREGSRRHFTASGLGNRISGGKKETKSRCVVFAEFWGVDTPPWTVSSCGCESLQVELGRDPRPLGRQLLPHISLFPGTGTWTAFFPLPQQHCALPQRARGSLSQKAAPTAGFLPFNSPPPKPHMKASLTCQPRSNVFLRCALRMVLLPLPALTSSLG